VGPGESAETTGIWAISILGGSPRKLRDDAGRASVSPSGAQIAYIGGRSQSEIWIMGAGGENPRKLLQAAPGDRFLQVQWSPDGNQIAYIELHNDDEKSQTTIETVPVSGGVSATILAGPSLGIFLWSADDRIIYSAVEPAPNSSDMNLWQIRVDRTGRKVSAPKRITTWAGVSLLDLSASADGKRLMVVKAGFQRDLYVADVRKHRILGAPRRFTLEGRDEIPSSWTPDGQRLFFYSNRNGNWDIFRQGLQERKAQEFILKPGDQIEPRVSPDARWVLYWDSAETDSTTAGMQLMRVPISGGAPEPVLQATRGAVTHCSRGHQRCVLCEPDRGNGELVFSTFDPASGRKDELIRIAADPASSPSWDLSSDGLKAAVVDLGNHQDCIRLVDLETGSGHSVCADQSAQLSGVSWSADGNGWFVTDSSVRKAAILYISSDGQVSQLWTTSTAVGAPLASPDGTGLAFTVSSYNSNAWMIEDF
jgi:Tol biopolymer transport system component